MYGATIEWRMSETRAAVCPVCGDGGDKPLQLLSHSLYGRDVEIVLCPACDARFIRNFNAPSYEDALPQEIINAYVEQMAGIDGMLEPLAALGRPAGNQRFVEIGCSYGFTLDFVRHCL